MQQVSSPLFPLVAFLTDFGLRDGYVGVLKGVVLSILPQAQLIDITHDIPPQDIVAGAWVLGASYRYFPSGTIYTCVVDPGVGSARQPIAVHAGDWFFVGPDNGLLSYVLTEQPVHTAVALSNPAYHLPQVSATFQGRDVFAPVAAHLARGVTLGDLGTPLDPSDLKLLDLKSASRQKGHVEAQIVYIDHFGNLISNISAHLVPDLFTCASVQLAFSSQGTVITERRHFFAGDISPCLNGRGFSHSRASFPVSQDAASSSFRPNGSDTSSAGLSFPEPRGTQEPLWAADKDILADMADMADMGKSIGQRYPYAQAPEKDSPFIPKALGQGSSGSGRDNRAQNELAASPFIYIDSSGYVGVARQNGNAAATLGIRVGDSLTLEICPQS